MFFLPDAEPMKLTFVFRLQVSMLALKTMASAVICVFSTREDISAHVQQALNSSLMGKAVIMVRTIHCRVALSKITKIETSLVLA